MLAVKMSAGVASEVNLRNPLFADNKTCKQGIYSSFETHKSKTMALQKGLMSSKFFLKNKKAKYCFPFKYIAWDRTIHLSKALLRLRRRKIWYKNKSWDSNLLEYFIQGLLLKEESLN